MSGPRRIVVLGVALTLVVAVGWRLAAEAQPPQDRRAALTKTMKAGNFKDAYDGLRKLALDPQNDKAQVGSDLELALQCLQRLGRLDEVDDFREAVIAVHKQNRRLLATAGPAHGQR